MVEPKFIHENGGNLHSHFGISAAFSAFGFKIAAEQVLTAV